ncbi:MAG: fibronectin type III domain-containing protein [Bacteroidales bacterium]|nr:fibronectin type III domain-containing protein [Bacteroidales bacterium]
MKNVLLFIGFWLVSLGLFALGKPEMRCLEVDENGYITVHWLAPNDMSGFSRYELYHATTNGNFSRIAVIMDASQVSYFDVNADALTQSSSYFLMAVSPSGEYYSDTLSTIELYLSNLANGVAQLNWTAPSVPLKPSYSNIYEVWKEYPVTYWNVSQTTTNLAAKDTNELCKATVGYRIELADASGCKNVSRPMADLFTDLISPKKPRFDSVSVDVNTNAIQLGWQPSISNDVAAYIIYHFENNVWLPIDTVFGPTNTYWESTDYNPEAEQHHFRIASMDNCSNASPLTDEAFTMQSSSQFDFCTQTAFISWTPYENMPDGVAAYHIYYSLNNGPWTFAGSAAGNENSYSFPGLVPNSDYSFIVKAINTFGVISASSTKTSFNFSPGDNKDFVYVRSVSVVNNSDIEVKVSTGSTISFTHIMLYRSVDSDTDFQLVKTLSNNGTNTYVFKDPGLKVTRKLYYYKAVIENSCGMQTAESNIAHNILLKATTEDYKNSLQWNDYGYWENGVAYYSIQRVDYKTNFYKEVAVQFEGNPTYEDNVSGHPEAGDKFIYKINALCESNPYGYEDVSVSNSVTTYQQPIVYISNAFRPIGGIITTYKPYTSFVNLSDYSFSIYSREGICVFSTTNPEEGWDGMVNEKTAMRGDVFVYKIKFSYGKDDGYEKSGTVTVVR